ncbi:phosphoribosyltransferase [Amycolatopsis thailandensis]|uniref:Phosphoribosyltransferase n=1 Tax=Amycolatopsis thailandensis TaxID=589330 RepID=A0A229RUA6_9PSEU|nr:phosphoribosyltransferase domain-containing protein [Amycolatopsis thailandensis]OXM50273.1 phosphoribosyltransferase [Amycolatopsis thailandensis]
MADNATTVVHGDGVAARVFEHQRIWRLTQEAFTTAAALIAAHEPAPEVVVGIARGGLPFARALAEAYRVPMAAVAARHNHSDEVHLPATGQVELPGEPGADLLAYRGARFLLVDDICGTGATYRAVLPWLANHLDPAGVRTAALCRSEASTFTPDAWVWDTLDWVVFPWNTQTSTTEDLTPPARPRIARPH